MGMFEITPDDVALLNDTDLRSLVGLLCESELRSRGMSAAAVTWSGHQNAADGGLDVRVALAEGETIEGFVPSPQTGFQVKKSPMPRAEILDEMRPKGLLRPIIRDLANRSGAYIIVSAESTSATPLQNRRDAMREAVNDLPNAKDLALDFYDRGRVASWVRDHAGMVVWVRGRVGRPLPGWRPYEVWAYALGGIEGEYLLDDTHRIRTDTETTESGLSTAEGIQRIRDRLRRPGSVVRLVGLSGVGKTRLVQALFDSRVGERILDPAAAIYTDIADGPDPAPATLVHDLIALRSKAVVVVDNCPPDMHHRLTEACRLPESTVSVITVEYDIREDQPEGTEVFELEASSASLIERLLQQRFAELSWVNLQTIAQFSDGNARIAIALAETVRREETIAGMSDEDLFKRLFEQRHGPSEPLLVAAQGLSLVYSFQGEDVSESHEAELFRLGAAVGKNTQEMFRSAAELHRRGLIQRRGVWRAVLPQAIANRLAARALQDTSTDTIEKYLVNDAPERIVKSFSRRLGYLDGSPEAEKIVRGWLRVDGLLADVLNLDDLGSTMLRNIAPVDPEATLSALERAQLEPTDDESAMKWGRYVSLLVSLAYEARDFDRSVRLLTKIAVAIAAKETSRAIGQHSNTASKSVLSLFPIYFSSTHASAEQRESVIRHLVDSSNSVERELGVKALAAALEAWHFGSALNFGFGARSRDFGYWPATRTAIVQWFSRFLKLAEDLGCSSHTEAVRVRTVIAEKFRGLWTQAAMYEDLERICHSISEKVFWIEGWIAVRQTTYYDAKNFAPEVVGRLASLEAFLHPEGTVQQVRSIVLAEAAPYVGISLIGDSAESVESSWSRLENLAGDLGRSVVVGRDTFAELLPELVCARGGQVWAFGIGLAQGTVDPVSVWKRLAGQLKIATDKPSSPAVFGGFINGLHQRDPLLAGSLLDEAIEDDYVGEWYPMLEAATGAIDALGLRRLLRSLEFGKAPIRSYHVLESGGVTHDLDGSEFNKLLLSISKRVNGVDVALQILMMRLSFNRDRSSPDELVEIGCDLVLRLNVIDGIDPNFAYRLQIVARECLVGEKGAETVREVCSKLREAVSKSETSAYSQSDFLQIIFEAQPIAVLQSLCSGEAPMVKIGISVLEHSRLLHPHAFDEIPEGELLRWCDESPDVRYPVAADGIVAIGHGTGGPYWTDIARKILARCPDRIQVLRRFIHQFSPPGWDIARAAVVQANLHLLNELADYSDPALEEFAVMEKARLSHAVSVVSEIRFPARIDLDGGFE